MIGITEFRICVPLFYRNETHETHIVTIKLSFSIKFSTSLRDVDFNF